MLPSHVSGEPGAALVLKELGLEPVIDAGMHLGEGTGALMLFPLLDAAADIYSHMLSFENAGIEAYTDYSCQAKLP